MWQLFVPAFLVIAAVVACGFASFDALVRHTFERHRAAWERSGRPAGFFWWPAGTSTLGRNACFFRWLITTPEWLRGDETGLALLRRFRALVLAGNALILLSWLAAGVFGNQ